MKTDYPIKLLPVIRYLEKNFNEPLNLKQVAELACLSPYHFHRIFKAVTGETLNEYIRRLRLEAAANELFYTKPSITSVALEYGFSSSQSLAKAFKQHFALTPSQIRECENVHAFSTLLRSSKIGHSLRKIGHAREEAHTYTGNERHLRSNNMEIKTFDSSHIAYLRVTGPYGENYDPALGTLYSWAGPQGLAGNTSIFIYHDNPEITAAENCRTDLCLMIDKSITPPQGIEVKHFVGGKYATIRKTITDKAQYGSTWDELIAQVVDRGLDTDDRPCFELYHHYDLETGQADVSFCTAIK
ncbi:helix-turn-helix domain-containing protein [Vibrio sp. 99-70-13A1]|uniref:AraC family transcriptional regulator n=1 Tax=Vibrio sp. 99-70-13A1 TaxID=2607601 RepID=UPI001493ACDB|nr:helix-turn-helix domain-containing protein [Vibrio sp. 99-70-13A1]NOH98336.1 AraC family transcriptional regulator [Vibrio sp. 99-70-13A1]